MHFPRLIAVTSREWIEAVAAARRQKGTKGWNQGQATHMEGEDWVTIMEGGEGAPENFRLPQSWLLVGCIESEAPVDPRCSGGGRWAGEWVCGSDGPETWARAWAGTHQFTSGN